MLREARHLIAAAAVSMPLVGAHAQAPADPSGHWEGAVHAPSGDVVIAVDLAFDDAGTLVGTFSNPSQQLTGFPLFKATADGRTLSLQIKTSDPGVQTLAGTLSADGRSLAGDFLVSVYSVPFSLKRTGAAAIAPRPRSAAVGAALAGEWRTSLDIGGKALPLSLTLTNHADGTATGSWSLGESSATPVVIEHDGRSVTLTSRVAPVAYTGTLSPDGTGLVGTFTEGTARRALSFTRIVAAR